MCAWLVLLPGVAWGQARPDLRAWLDTETVEVGQPVQLTMQATSESETPRDPQLAAAPGLVIRKTGEMPTHMSFNFNGVKSEKHTIMATWQIRPSKTGTFTIGPATVAVGAVRYSTKAVKLTVVPAGSAPHLPRTGPTANPMDPFKGLFGQDFDDDPFKPAEPKLEPDPKLALPAPLGAVAFLHAFVDKSNVVVGEQVTLTVHLYIDAGEREPDFHDVHEASAPDFARKSLQDNDTQAGHVGIAQIAGRLYAVKLLRKSALFPLKAGDLDIGPMTVTVGKTRAVNGARASEALKVRATEAPVAGRPPGYVVGTVGKMQLTAEVTPRDTPAGGAIAVTVELSGTGNLPASLAVPALADVEWLEPQIHDKLGHDGGRYGGKRTFAYVLKLHKEGKVDLGDLTLPFFDPERGAYDVARASLGVVTVSRGQASRDDAARIELLPDLPSLRAGLEGQRPNRTWIADSLFYWLGLGGGPIVWALAVGARSTLRRARRRAEERAASPATELKRRIAAADEACAAIDRIGARKATATIAHALEAATLARLSVNVRGISRGEVHAALRDVGLSDGDAEAWSELLGECDDIRFSPNEADATEVSPRWKRARSLIDALPRGEA